MDFSIFPQIIPFFKRKASNSSIDTNTMSGTQHNMNEVIIVSEHTDIIRDMVVIDQFRFATCGDDCTICIVDHRFGDVLFLLEGHTRIVTCLLAYKNYLVSGSADKTIRIWDVDTGECLFLLEKCGSVSCLALIDDNTFCCGGNMNRLLIWSFDGILQNEVSFDVDENMYCLLPISENRIAIGVTSPLLLIYDIQEGTITPRPSTSRETIRCLERIDDNHFVSGSLDGVIQIWDSNTVEPINQLHYPNTYKSRGIYLYPVHQIRVFNSEYMAACYGQNYTIWNLKENCSEVYARSEAHDGSSYDIISINDGKTLVTCGSDAEINLWECPQALKPPKDSSTRSNQKRRSRTQKSPTKLGNLRLHSNQVRLLLKLNESTFISGSHDGLAIIWKNGKTESQNRNLDAREYLQKPLQSQIQNTRDTQITL